MLQGVMRNSTIGLLCALDMRPEDRNDTKYTLCMTTERKATFQEPTADAHHSE